MQVITHELKKEANIEVLTFVTSYLKKASLSVDPKMQNMTMTIKSALEAIHTPEAGILDSRVYSFEQYIEKAGPIAADIKLALYNSGISPVPNSLMAKLATSVFGKKVNVAELGVFTSGLK